MEDLSAQERSMFDVFRAAVSLSENVLTSERFADSGFRLQGQ
jgi:hypothetical protein